jgi:hypothetical protein
MKWPLLTGARVFLFTFQLSSRLCYGLFGLLPSLFIMLLNNFSAMVLVHLPTPSLEKVSFS